MCRIFFCLAMMVTLFISSLVYSDVPKLVNFQGRLTDATGKFVPDGSYAVTFRLYTDSIGGIPKWSELQSVVLKNGLFNVILGSIIPIPDSIFDYSNTWLGIKVGLDPEMSPRQRFSSLGYSYHALNSDKLDGLHAVDFTKPTSDYGRSGVATDLYEGTSTLTDKYLNSLGPDSVYSSLGTALLGKVSGSSSGILTGIRGNSENSSDGDAYGGYFLTSSAGTGNHYGIKAECYGASANGATGSYCYAHSTSTGPAIGCNSIAYGNVAFGGYFSAPVFGGPGNKFAIYAHSAYRGVDAYGDAIGLYASAPTSGWAGYFDGHLSVTGAKNAAVKVDDGEYRLLYCQESPEVWFEDFGGGALQNGVTTIQIDPLFSQTVNTQIEYRVYLTPEGDCKGLYIVNKMPNSFEVRELQGGTSNIPFSYRIVAKRKGYENLRLVKPNGPTPEEVKRAQLKHQGELMEERTQVEWR